MVRPELWGKYWHDIYKLHVGIAGTLQCKIDLGKLPASISKENQESSSL